MKNITDKNLIYLRKILRANLYWYGKTAFSTDRVVDATVDRILSVIASRYELRDKTTDVGHSE